MALNPNPHPHPHPNPNPNRNPNKAVYSGEYKSSGDGRLEVRWDDLERAFREVRPVKARWGAQATRGARWARVRELRLRTRKYLPPEEGAVAPVV